MAASKWLDFWPLANWLDTTRTPLFTIWQELKNAADERVSFVKQKHDTTYLDSETFPDYVKDNNLAILSDVVPSYLERIETNLTPDGTNCFKMDTDSFKPGLTRIPANFAQTIGLPGILTGPLGYPSGTLLLDTDSANASQEALARMAHIKQFYESIDYADYYRTFLFNSPFIENQEFEQYSGQPVQQSNPWIEVDVIYEHTGTTFTSCVANISNGGVGGMTDVYIPGDLNEVAPFSSLEDVRTYAISKLNAVIGNWESYTGAMARNENKAIINSEWSNSGGNRTKQITLTYSGFRFKAKEAFRPTAPDKFRPHVYYYDAYDYTDDFGTGEADNILRFEKFTPDGNDFNYIQIENLDYSGVPIVQNENDPQINHSIFRYMGWVAGANASVNLAPNEDEVNGFTYYKQ